MSDSDYGEPITLPDSLFAGVARFRMEYFFRGEITERDEENVVPEEGVEPTRPCDQRILSPPRLPFRHSGVF
jgi:hypothetical protein